jgi:hypothetical protein
LGIKDQLDEGIKDPSDRRHKGPISDRRHKGPISDRRHKGPISDRRKRDQKKEELIPSTQKRRHTNDP